jgi:hypothetical protein
MGEKINSIFLAGRQIHHLKDMNENLNDTYQTWIHLQVWIDILFE